MLDADADADAEFDAVDDPGTIWMNYPIHSSFF